MSNNPIHVKLRISKEFHKLLEENKVLGSKVWRIKISKARGHCRPERQWVSVPKWALQLGYYYALVYMIHEVAHILTNGGHKADFKRQETRLLKRYGISIKRKKVYVKSISCNGQQVYLDKIK